MALPVAGCMCISIRIFETKFFTATISFVEKSAAANREDRKGVSL